MLSFVFFFFFLQVEEIDSRLVFTHGRTKQYPKTMRKYLVSNNTIFTISKPKKWQKCAQK